MSDAIDPIYFGLVPVPPANSTSSPTVSPLDAALELHKARPEWTPPEGYSEPLTALNLNGGSESGSSEVFSLTGQADIPPVNENLNRSVPIPYEPQLLSPEAAIPGFFEVHLAGPIGLPPEEISGEAGTVVGFPEPSHDEAMYKRRVINKLTITYMKGMADPGFRDAWGYVIEINGEGATQLGEGYYFTAIAAATFAMQNYNAESWLVQTNNEILMGLFHVLDVVSWGNEDSSGTKHPIRHVDMRERHSSGIVRNRPMSKDAFGPTVAACYFAYNCPNSTPAVRDGAKGLLTHWVEYLSKHNWMLHSKHLDGEFDRETEDGMKKYYKNLMMYENGEVTGRISYLGLESFILLPYELYALKHCASSLGVVNSISPWVNASSAIAWSVSPIITTTAKAALRYVLDHIGFSKDYSFELIPGVTVPCKLELHISKHRRDDICDEFEKLMNNSGDQNWFDPNAQNRGSR